MKKYPVASKDRKINLYHFDLYRITDTQEILDLGWKEILEDEDNLVIVEWPEKILDILPEKRIDIKFESVSENVRSITFHFL
jgi:tRNA threonylcarbamoyladenosine biosynthesis protein TsaE